MRERVAAAEESLRRAREELEVRQALLDEAEDADADDLDEGELRGFGEEVAEMEQRVAEFEALVEGYEEVGAFVEDI